MCVFVCVSVVMYACVCDGGCVCLRVCVDDAVVVVVFVECGCAVVVCGVV